MVLFIYIKLFLCYYNRIKTELVSQVLGGKWEYLQKYNLFDSFDDYGKNEVLEAISSLSEEEQNILRKRFGDDLGIIVIIRKATNKLFFDFILTLY